MRWGKVTKYICSNAVLKYNLVLVHVSILCYFVLPLLFSFQIKITHTNNFKKFIKYNVLLWISESQPFWLVILQKSSGYLGPLFMFHMSN